jgi:hypothetical protein
LTDPTAWLFLKDFEALCTKVCNKLMRHSGWRMGRLAHELRLRLQGCSTYGAWKKWSGAPSLHRFVSFAQGNTINRGMQEAAMELARERSGNAQPYMPKQYNRPREADC